MKKVILLSMLTIGLLTPATYAEDTSVQIKPVGEQILLARTSKKKNLKKKRRSRRSTKKRKRRYKAGQLAYAKKLAKQGKYEEASKILFKLSVSPRYRKQKMQVKYLLGSMLYNMKMYQVAAFQFISVIKMSDGRSNRYLRQSLEKLSLAADALGDDTLLNYAISRVSVNRFPKAHKSMLFFRIGEFQVRNEQYSAAIKSFQKVSRTSDLYPKAKYLEALAYSKIRKTKSALRTFDRIISHQSTKSVTDPSRVAAIIGKARVYYQMKDWDKALEFYREVPRDTSLWHDTLFESSWAMMRSGQFRSALSNFQSLHSAYYDDTYLPESLLLRSIVYLYICQYDEMDKVLNLFNKIYKPTFKNLSSYIKETKNTSQYYKDIAVILRDSKNKRLKSSYSVPLIVARKVIQEGDFQRSYQYIQRLTAEKKRILSTSKSWKYSGLGKYAKRTINRRIKKARSRAGRQVKAHLANVKTELIDFFEQEGFIRYEMINGKKESLKMKVANKSIVENEQVDDGKNRDYYVQNGYQYWKFRGEYWLDELGNYYYVGMQSCKN